MTFPTQAWSETVRLCKGFMRLRHSFPNKQGRSKLRRWINMMFSLKQLEYQRIAEQHGIKIADEQAMKWRAEAREDLGSEWQRRAFIDRVTKDDA